MATAPGPVRASSIHPDTAIGTVALTVSDLARSRSFYERVIGLMATELADGALALGLSGERPLIELRGDAAAPSLDRRRTGLYHLAMLLPTRGDLAIALARLAEARWPLDGASDHLVSEALYLSDPDGNGIEIYRDRPREQWPRAAGRVEIATLPLDINDLLAELDAAAESERVPLPAGTRIGHIHLQVSDLDQAEAFYSGILGFDVMVRGYPGTLFVSAGGYHHHIGLNTWHSAGAAAPPPGSVGLLSFEVVLPSEEELARVLERIQGARLAVQPSASGELVRDPSGNGLVLRAA